MAEPVWQMRSAFEGRLKPGHYGSPKGRGLVVRERTGLSLIQVLSAPGDAARVAQLFVDGFGITAPEMPKSIVGSDLRLSWMGPGNWLALGAPGLQDAIANALGSSAALIDQSHARGVLRLGGADVRSVLAKGFQIDLHPRVFGVGDTALTTLAHGAAQLWQVDDAPSFDLVAARSVSGDIWHWLKHAGAEFGVVVGEPLDGFARG